MAGQPKMAIERSRSAFELIGATFALYRRFPLLFLVLAGAVVVPYQLIVLVLTGAGPITRGQAGAGAEFILSVADLGLVVPLISGLHAHAVDDVRKGNRPRLPSVARRGLTVLPVVSAAVIISTLAVAVGFVALIVPGVLLLLRWSVVAQAAALADKSWGNALNRSTDLSSGHYRHIFGLVFSVEVVSFGLSLLARRAFGHSTTTVPSFLVGTALQILLQSFTALAAALLYFDLTARLHEGARGVAMTEPSADAADSEVPSGPGDPLTPDGYTDQNRPRGWYIDPSQPRRMRFWAADGKPGWSKRPAKTPGQMMVEWEELGARREEQEKEA
jgi:hypothetical protein